tara:strand:+ start:64682 stop:65914 length:1233 start_codon:yes stop_codon:yes gene_type:complete
MSRFLTSACVALIILIITGVANAEVVAIEGTIKSVDAKKRTITVQTKSKTLELDVSRKAKISVKDKAAKLDSLKPGQKVQISYHDGLEIVLKIEATGDASRIKELTITIGIDGRCKLAVKNVSGNDSAVAEHKSHDSVIDMDIFGGAAVTKNKDGSLRVLYDFTEFKNVDSFMAAFRPKEQNEARQAFDEQVSIDQGEGVLLLTPGKNKRSLLALPRRINGPTKLSVQFRGFSEGLFQVQFYLGQELLLITLTGDPTPEHKPNSIVVSFRDKNKKFNNLLTVQESENTAPPHEFKIASSIAQMSGYVSIGHFGQLPVGLTRLEIAAEFPPSFGMALKNRDNRVIVGRTIDGSVAAKVGIRKGDILTAVNGKTVKNLQNAMALLGKCTLGETSKLEIIRLGKKQIIAVKPR